jgi:hypothetical protein
MAAAAADIFQRLQQQLQTFFNDGSSSCRHFSTMAAAAVGHILVNLTKKLALYHHDTIASPYFTSCYYSSLK